MMYSLSFKISNHLIFVNIFPEKNKHPYFLLILFLRHTCYSAKDIGVLQRFAVPEHKDTARHDTSRFI